MHNQYQSKFVHKHDKTQARVMSICTPHGEFITPAFMPVATRAYINHMTVDDIASTQSDIILGGNTYHMLCEPGMEVIQANGGMHHFMDWKKPMLTDSGGFQVFSLSKNKKICKIDDDGAHFKHPVSGKLIHLTPTSSIQAQKIIGADIIMAFDECTPEQGGRPVALAAMERTQRWLLESKQAHDKNPNSAYGLRQALFGIIQGGSFQDLRIQCCENVLEMDLDGIAIGGEAIGFDMVKTQQIIDWVRPLLPQNKIRYTMGVGLTPQDLLDVVACGVDIFDCVAPTRNARHGALYHGHVIPDKDWLRFDEHGVEKGRLLIKKSQYRLDERPILEGCECKTCRHYTRSYLHYLFKNKSPLYYQLACNHNVFVMQDACVKMKETILHKT